MSDLEVSLTISTSLAQRAHCILCGSNPLLIERQEGLPDRIRCIRCNLALEMDTTRQYMRIAQLPQSLSGHFNPDWMRMNDLKKYIKYLYDGKAGTSSIPSTPHLHEEVSLPSNSAPHSTTQALPTADPAKQVTPPQLHDAHETAEELPRWLEIEQFASTQSGKICTFLKLQKNVNMGLAYSSRSHACYKISPPQLVSMTHQEEICLSGQLAGCPILASGFEGPFPLEIRGKPLPKYTPRWILSRAAAVLAILFILASVGIAIINIGIIKITAVPAPIPELLAQFGLSPRQVSIDLAAAASTPVPYQAATVADTAQSNAYGQDIVLGPQDEYIVHTVLEGETMTALVKTYHMPEDAIKKVNPLANYGLAPLIVLVMVPGVHNLDELSPLKAVRITTPITLPELLMDYQIYETIFRTYNQLTTNLLLPGKWIILPYNARFSPPSTPTPTPKPSS